MKHNKRAFTLIELLVVVLIIGILTAVALPQYQKAVEKSKAMQVLSLLKSIWQTQEIYYLNNWTYATKFSQLDNQISWTGSSKWRTDSVSDTLSSKDWSLQIYNDGTYSSMSLGLLQGPYKGAGFVIYMQPRPLVEKGKIYCVERDMNGVVFERQRGDYCTKLWNGQVIYSANPVIFSMP